MRGMYFVFVAALVLAPALSSASTAPNNRHPVTHASKSIPADVRAAARKLAHAWVDTASANTLDSLASRSIAFAGMVPGVYVVLDGKRQSAARTLTDSSLTILGTNTASADAEAIRTTVATLMEIADGRATRGRK